MLNEQLAHSLIMDPQFQLPDADDPPPFTTPGVSAVAGSEAPGSRHTPLSGKEELSGRELNQRLQNTMHTMFWRKLVISLTPPLQSRREDFVVGAIVQARYGGPQGSYYEATVTAVNDDSTFAIRYLEDNVVEDKVPLENFRLATDRVDARPLLALIDETRTRLENLTPRRADLIANYREVLDAPLLKQMLTAGVLDGGTILRLFNFVLDSVQRLEAPARSDRTLAWRSQFDAYIQGLVAANAAANPTPNPAAAAGTDGGAGAGAGVEVQIGPMVALLPVFFGFVFGALDQLSRDLVNSQLRMLAPQVAGETGIEYERERFTAKLDKGLVGLDKTSTWLTSHAGAWCAEAEAGAAPGGAGGGDSDVYTMRREGLANGLNRNLLRECVADGVLRLVQMPVRLDGPDGAASLPETMAWDGKRLASVRDSMDRVVLVATLLVIARQVLSQKRVIPSDEVMEGLRSKLDWLLQQPNTRLPNLQRAVQDTAAAACAAAGGGAGAAEGAGAASTSTLEPELIETLSNLVSSAADPKNSVFALFQKRAYFLLRHMVHAGAAASTGTSAAVDGTDRVAAALGATIGKSGLKAFQPLLLETGRRLRRFIDLNSAVHWAVYTRLLHEAASALPLASPPVA